MTTPLDISTFVYRTGTLNISPGDMTAVFSGSALSTSVKDGDYLIAGGSLAVIETVTDDTHVDLFTEWAGSGVSAGPYLILKASLLRYHTALIGYDSASFLALLDGTTVWYAVEGGEPDPSIGEEGQRALKSNVTPWKVWLKTGGVWVLQAGSPGGPGATILVQDAAPDTDHPDNSLWIDSDSADLDVYALTGSPPAWIDTGMNLKGATGPAAWLPPEAWVTATAYVEGPPASVVTQGGETYVCLVAHTSGTFATDLAAGKWIKVAAKGADGTGVGDVVGPASATDAHIVLFDTTSGKKIQDSGKSLSDLATAAQGAKADSAVQPGDLGSAATADTTDFATAAQGLKADSAVQSIVEGANIIIDDTDPANPIISATGGGAAFNRLINPSGQIWQRANSGSAAITDVTYAFDRWYGLTQSAGVTASQVTNAENGTPYMMRLSQANATAQRFGIAQAIESANIIDARGQSVTLSARVRMSASTTLRYAIVEWTGTADTITKDIVASWTSTTFTPGNFFTSTSTTVVATGSVALTANTLASISLTGTVSGSMNNLIVFFWTDSTQAQNVTLDVGKVQLEIGSGATALAVRSASQELGLCEYYYRKSYALNVAPGTAQTGGAASINQILPGSGNWRTNITYGSRMRTVPTATLYDNAGTPNKISFFISSWSNGGTGTAFTFASSMYVEATGAAVINFEYTLNAEL